MSALGVSSYFLWTQKGTTVLPLVRGSGFLMKFNLMNSFYKYHVVTAAHVSCPVKYRSIYGDTVGLKAIGERHISTRLLFPNKSSDKVGTSLNLEFRQNFMPNVDVASLRIKEEKSVQEVLDSCAIEPDLDPIEENAELVLCGTHAIEERANPNDDGLTLKECRLAATVKAALLSLDYGTVLLASVDGPSTGESKPEDLLHSPLPLSMCGGPVLRKSSGKCVGVTVARVMKAAPPRDPHSGTLYQDPYLDISEHADLQKKWPLDVAFVPIGEFYDSIRRSEM